MRVVDLRVEREVAPIGLGLEPPRFSWRIEDGAQTGYRIVAREGDAVRWDSGRVESEARSEIPWAGEPLAPRSQIAVSLTVFGGGTEATAETTFETALGQDWRATWIGGPLVGGPRTGTPAPRFRQTVLLGTKPARARLYVTAGGVYEGDINGQRVGDAQLAPGWTDYRDHLRYQTYDVTDLLREGENELGFVVGDGWWCGHVEWRGRQMYGDRPILLAQLEVDGEVVAATDESWHVEYGPILQADLIMGEHHDHRLHWSGGTAAQPMTAPKGQIVPQYGPLVRETERLRGDRIRETSGWPSSTYLYDFRQNLVGHLRLKLKGEPGATLKIVHGEILDAKGNLYTENLRSAQQTDYVTLCGDAEGEWFEPRLTFHGFRYALMTPSNGAVEVLEAEAVVVHSDYQRTGEFTCSEPLLNQLWQNIHWGWRGNSVDVPTDCPQRDERLGWTGDAQVFVRTSTYLADVATFWEKYVQDLADSQTARGSIPPTAPDTNAVKVGDGGPAWADAMAIVPWTVYRVYGDRQILERHFPAVERFLGFLRDTEKDGVRCHPDYPEFQGFLDWLNIDAPTPADVIGTAYYAYSADLASRMAGVLGLPEKEQEYRELFARIKDAFRRHFVTGTGVVTPGSQTAQVLALRFGLLEPEEKAGAVQQLVNDVRRRGTRLSTGFVGSSYLPHVLTDHGRADVAFDLLLQKAWPSWLYAVTQGATTIWERWDGWTEDKGFQDAGMNSFNHYAYGAIGEWLMQRVAGIDLDPEVPGYRSLRMRPLPGPLTHCRAAYDTDYGRVGSEWRVEADRFRWTVLLPPGTSALAELPGGETRELGPGQHELETAVMPD